MSTIHPIFERLVPREEKEKLLGQKGKVYWLYGPSGSGKTTIAVDLERRLVDEGKFAVVIDGDNLRSGLNEGLGFSTEDRMENIRRAAELAKILVQNGVIVICCFVCPLRAMREKAKYIIGEDMIEVYIKTSLETLISRDTKGFYKKAQEGMMENLTGINAEFEEPLYADFIIDTDKSDVRQAMETLYRAII